MDWNPKHWNWPPRILAALRDFKPAARRKLAKGWERLRKTDRKDFRRLWVRAKSYARSYYFTTLVLIAVALAWPWWDMLMTIRGNLSQLMDAGPALDKDGVPDVRGHYYSVAILIGAMAALITAPLTLLKAYINERQTDAAEQGLITDRFTKAVEQLGAEKTVKYRIRSVRFLPKGQQPPNYVTIAERTDNEVELPKGAGDVTYGEWTTLEETVPNLEVRLGAIYALERIAQDSERDHIPIIETMCAYIRENSQAHTPTKEERTRRPRVDIQAVLDVLSRRPAERIEHESAKGFTLDMTYADFGCRDLHGLNFRGVNLANSNLNRADLKRARLDGADLRFARLDGADLWSAWLDGADLRQANLNFATLRDWSCARTSLRSADFTGAQDMTQDHVNAAFGDSGTKLPEGIVIPDHWDDETIAPWDDDPKYQAWLDAGAPPGKPRGGA